MRGGWRLLGINALDGGVERPPLPIYLEAEPYDAYLHGKDIEVREDGPRWSELNLFEGRRCFISRGYGKAHRRPGRVGKIWRETMLWSMPDKVLRRARMMTEGDGRSAGTLVPSRFVNLDVPVVAFEVLLE